MCIFMVIIFLHDRRRSNLGEWIIFNGGALSYIALKVHEELGQINSMYNCDYLMICIYLHDREKNF